MNQTELQARGLQLLSLAGTIRRYEDELTRVNGAHFNLFDVLHIGHYEVRTHSPMLAELLNPRGSHG
ncbi:MAG: PD-(D/E)XK nuclease family protein, partial [Luteolibacter sp.]